MAVLTGAEGRLSYGGTDLGYVRNWSITVTRDALEVTSLGDTDRVYTPGLRGATGTATLLYDADMPNAEEGLWNKIFTDIDCDEDKAPSVVLWGFNTCKPLNGNDIAYNVYVTSFTHSVSVGEVQTATITFTCTGAPLDDTPYTG